MTRVSAKYIRKMAKQYNIEILHPLRSKAIKAMYVEKIAEAIINMELATMSLSERNDVYQKGLEEALEIHPGYYAGKINYFNFCVSIKKKGAKFVGEVGITISGIPWYRTAMDGSNVRRKADSIMQAVTLLIGKHEYPVTA